MPRRGRLARLAVVAALAALAAPVGAASAATDATTTLAQTYAPVVVVRAQDSPCGDGEPYQPTPVTTVLGAEGVVLRGPDGQEVAAPTAADLAGKGEGWFLDQPGNPLDPGCDYETFFRQRSAGIAPTVYARVATDPEHPDRLALQYWFFYSYNDWNDKHEGDWEMVQVVLPAATVEQALQVQPESVAYAQHEGSQVAAWGSPGLTTVGDHPVVYPGEGSHAAYYAQETWFGKSAQAGFGCDSTVAPGVRLEPDVVVLPAGTTPPTTGEFAWLSYTGRWGQQAPSFNNGPTGPVTKTQWDSPITWMREEGRTSAVALPPVPSPAMRAFCSVTSSGSLLGVDALDSPVLVAVVLLGLVGIVAVLATRTRWRHPASEDPDRSRRAGQIVTGAFGWVRRHPRAVGGLALMIFGYMLAARLVQQVVLTRSRSADIAGTSPGWLATTVLVLLLVVLLFLVGWAAAAGIAAVGADARGEVARAGTSLGTALRRPAGIGSAAAIVLATLLMSASLVLLPLAGWLVAVYAATPAAAVLEGLPLRAALDRSRRLTRGRRWRTLLVVSVLVFVGLSLSGLVGAVLILATSVPFAVIGLAALVLIALLLPVTFAGLALQFFDLRARAEGVPAGRDPVAV